MIGEVVGSYRIVGKLGEGGMGAVYVAHHTLLGRKAAIKVLLPAFSRQPEVVERFFNEARAVTSMSDPGIVQIFDFGYHTDGSAFLVMELLEGEPLNARLAQRGRLSAVESLRIGRQVAVSLATAHSHGVVHRDLKPENVFMVRDAEVAHGERAKILDFGIAKLSGDGASRKTSTGALLGTPTYMSPEQCRGAGEVDHRSDIYALGCLLFHLLTGAPPFLGEGIGDIIAAHLREPAPAPSSRVPGLPPALDALVLRCLAKAAGARHASMGELAGAIEQLLVQQASAEKATYMLPAAGRTPAPMLLTPPGSAWPSGTSNPSGPSNPLGPSHASQGAGPSGASYPAAAYPAYPSGPSGLAHPGGASGMSNPASPSHPSNHSTPANSGYPSHRGLLAPLSTTPAPGFGGSPGSQPGTGASSSPTTLGSAASQRAAEPARAPRRAGRLVGGLAFAGVVAAAAIFMVSQRGKGGEVVDVRAASGAESGTATGTGTATGDAARTSPTGASVPSTTASSTSATPTVDAANPSSATALTEAAKLDAAKAEVTRLEAAKLEAARLEAAKTTAAKADEAAAADATRDSSRRRRPRSSRSGSSSSSSSSGGCDRSVDTDCDGIPDVR